MLTRRRLLGGIGGLGATALAGAGARRSFAGTGGYKILEIYCFGGVFRWNAIRPADIAFSLGEAPFDLSQSQADWDAIAGDDAWAPTTLDPVEAGPFALGPAAAPLLGGSARDAAARRLLDVTRLVPMTHDLNAHEVAEPFVLTGDRPGRATGKGLGAMMNRLYDDGSWHSIVLDCAGAVIPRQAASSVGMLGLHYRPHVFPVPPAEVYALLDRTGLTTLDTLRSALTDAYGQQLVHPSLGARVRSKGFDAYESAWNDLANHDIVKSTLTDAQVAASSYDDGTWAGSTAARAVTLAIELLRGSSGNDVRSVTILEGSANGSYDTHTYTGDTQDGGLWAVLRALAIAHEAQPLDDILVYIHSEFGRLDLDGEHTGSEHWCYGYDNLLIGGPIRSAAHAGNFDVSSGGLPVGGDGCWSPTDLYGALLWAAQPDGEQRDPFTEITGDAGDTVPLLDVTLKGAMGLAAGSPAAIADALFGEA